MSKLKVIALISGGKDSFFSILHCRANGHEVVALANLYPETSVEDAENEDIDSFMYQTVGHSVIPLYAEALGIPLYRQKIVGGSGSMERDYAPAIDCVEEQDETESLVPLLKKVKEVHPDATAICTGAILSTYQRTRVESVALRLNLIPLSYLWQFPFLPPYTQTSLLEDMRAIGQDSRIIKVASGALDESFLWKNVADQANVAKMVKRMEMFGGSVGGAVLGEGGEFETLAVDGPRPLWKGRIEAGSVEVVKGEGGSAVVRLKDISIVKKEDTQDDRASLRIPDLLDTEFKALLLDLETVFTKADGLKVQEQTQDVPQLLEEGSNNQTSNTIDAFIDLNSKLERPRRGLLQISNIFQSSGTPSNQLKGIMEKLSGHLKILHLDSSSIVSTTLLLRSMSDFTSLNPIYGTFFTTPNPPSRVTISCGALLPPDIDVILSATVDLGDRKERQGLHVQSRSYWAPANIGPYSQAISVPIPPLPASDGSTSQPRIVHIAGQIPLVPSSMDIVTSNLVPLHDPTPSKEADFISQTVLSLQHLFRIGRATEVKQWTGGLAFISQCSPSESKMRAEIAIKAWTSIHRQAFSSQQSPDSEEEDDEEEIDVWDLRNRAFGFQTTVEGKVKKEDDTRSLLPDYTMSKSLEIPPVFVAQVESLPRGADIEWFSNGLTSITTSSSPQSWHAVHHVEDLLGFGEKEGLRLEYTVYTTKALPKKFLEMGPVFVPCFRVWWEGEDGRGVVEIEAVVGVRWYPN